MIEVKNLTKKFTRNSTEFDAVHDVSLEVKEGEFAAIIGHSGSGKTTLFNMIAGLIAPTSGEVYIDGSEITKMGENEKAIFRNNKMGYVLQGQSLLNNFTILDNICMPAYLSPDIDEFKERALELLKQIGLEEFANEYPSNLSGGEIRRVSIIRAMINNPKVIVADEPTSNLDPENSHKVMQMLKDISKTGTTVLLSTHELEYLSYVDTVFKMDHGVLEN
ncbi:MAG: ABC transporter ATP-binding protein [Peptacetobacter hiranonis]|uniref:ABC transporter ATP-binding protein n=1 Tax=Peptacetobacter hiranonis TaxID=89152 RepID=UPI0022E62F30|nr:ABC transporter ATP-binding protein [Peptacetobacter hiranonis]MED9946898.1 ABC transporter ATP-binding protein [Peptacetobacter hiranonis]